MSDGSIVGGVSAVCKCMVLALAALFVVNACGVVTNWGEMGLLYGDNEVRARIAESEELCYDEGNDWANPGCQSKIVRGPMKDESTIR